MAHLRKHFDRPFATLRDDAIAGAIEFLGTTTFLLLGLGGIQAAATSNINSLNAAGSGQDPTGGSNGGAKSLSNAPTTLDQIMFISVSFGLALLTSAWMFYRVTGGVFNPSVALTLFLCGVIGPVRLVFYFVAEMVGAIVASAILSALLPGPLTVTPSLGSGTSRSQGVFIEMFITAALCLAVLMLAVEKHRATPLAPIGIGLTLFACHLFAVMYTGAAMNTARAFGPSVVTGFASNHWIYWLGPFLGSLLAVAIYAFLKMINYGHLNPGQDSPNSKRSPELFTDANTPNGKPMRENSTSDDRTVNGHTTNGVTGPHYGV